MIGLRAKFSGGKDMTAYNFKDDFAQECDFTAAVISRPKELLRETRGFAAAARDKLNLIRG